MYQEQDVAPQSAWPAPGHFSVVLSDPSLFGPIYSTFKKIFKEKILKSIVKAPASIIKIYII